MKKFVALTLLVFFSVTLSVSAQDSAGTLNPKVKAETLDTIQKLMLKHIKDHAIKGIYLFYDAVTDELLRLKFKEAHSGVFAAGEEFYASCMHFTDSEGTLYDLDVLVAEEDGKFRVLQTIVHSVDEQKRPYHLED
jgi:hypothetical protein